MCRLRFETYQLPLCDNVLLWMFSTFQTQCANIFRVRGIITKTASFLQTIGRLQLRTRSEAKLHNYTATASIIIIIIITSQLSLAPATV